MKKMKKAIVIVLCMAIAFVTGRATAEVSELVGKTMPDFTVTTSDGEALSLQQVLGKKDVVVLNIFTTWCPPCRMEFPDMERVYRDLSGRMEIIAVSDEPDDTLGDIAEYKEELGLSFPMGLGKGVSDFAAIEGYPTTLVIDSSGMIGYYQLGAFANEAQFRRIVDYFTADHYDGTPAGAYNVYVCDQDGQPVPGVVLKFCDTACQLYTSDAEGIIAFVGRPVRYSIQIVRVPDGYGCDASFEAVCDGSGEWVIVQVAKE